MPMLERVVGLVKPSDVDVEGDWERNDDGDRFWLEFRRDLACLGEIGDNVDWDCLTYSAGS